MIRRKHAYIWPQPRYDWDWRALPKHEHALWLAIQERWVIWNGGVSVGLLYPSESSIELWHKLCLLDYESLQFRTKLSLPVIKQCERGLLDKKMITFLGVAGNLLFPNAPETSFITPCILFNNSREGWLWHLRVEKRSRYIDAHRRVPRKLWTSVGIRGQKSFVLSDVPTQSGYVYLVKREGENHYKIGKSIHPVTRIKRLEVVLPFPIKVCHLIECVNYDQMEMDLHRKFARKRLGGEWFDLSPDDVEYIKSLGQEIPI